MADQNTIQIIAALEAKLDKWDKGLNDALAKMDKFGKQGGAKMSPMKKAFDDIAAQAKKTGEEIARHIGNGIQNAFRSVGGAAYRTARNTLMGAGAAAAGGYLYSLKKGMEAIESENLFDVSLGPLAKQAREWSEKTSEELRLDPYALRESLGTFNVMLTSMGIGAPAAFEMSKAMTQLSMDMASFYNLKPEEAFLKLQSGITGEAEPLKRLGILVNETTVQQYALTKGWVKQGEELTEQQKTMGRYMVIMEQTKKAQGDMARTMDSPANRMRQISGQVQAIAKKFGEGQWKGPQLGNFLGGISDWLANNGDKVIGAATAFMEKLSGAIQPHMARLFAWLNSEEGQGKIKEFSDKAVALTDKLIASIPSIVDGITSAGKVIGEILGKIIQFAKDHPELTKWLVGGMVANKVTGGAVGGIAGSLLKGGGKIGGSLFGLGKGLLSKGTGAAGSLIEKAGGALAGRTAGASSWIAKGLTKFAAPVSASLAATQAGLWTGTKINEKMGVRNLWMKMAGVSDKALAEGDGAVTAADIAAMRARAGLPAPNIPAMVGGLAPSAVAPQVTNNSGGNRTMNQTVNQNIQVRNQQDVQDIAKRLTKEFMQFSTT